MKKYLLLILVIILAAFLRINQLEKVPAAMSDDETRLVLSSYSIWKTGRDLNGNFLPLSFVINGYSFNPVPIYLTSPFVGLLGLSMISARLPFAISGIITVLFVYLLAEKLTRNKTHAVIASFVLSVNVWHITLSRFAYEGRMALMFYTIGTYLFLCVQKRNYFFLILSLLAFTLGFFSYSGYKLTVIPILILLVWYQRKLLVRNQVLVIITALIMVFGALFYLGKTQGSLEYGGNLVFFQDKGAIEQTVELERRASVAPEILKKIYHNKATVVLRTFLEHYMYGYSPQYLFLDQEASGIFSVWSRGEFYYHESALLFLGILFLFLKNRKQFVLIAGLLLIAGLPGGLGPAPYTYAIRNSFALPWFAVLIAGGIISFRKKAFIALIAFFYVYFVAGYLTQYYYDWSRYGAKYYASSDRDLAVYVKDTNQPVYVSDGQMMTFLHFAFYNKISPADIQTALKKEPFQVNSLIFDSTCISKKPGIFIMSASCYNRQKIHFNPHLILKAYDGEPEWYIFQ